MKLEVVNSGPSSGPTIGVFPTGDVSSPLYDQSFISFFD